MNRVNAEPEHLPVMLEETLRCLAPRPGETMLDGTLGLGGHAAEILSRLSPGGELIGLDRDPEALTLAAKRLDGVGGNYRLLHGTFDRVGELLKELELSSDGAFDGLLLDLGVSSMQLDRAERGFSFRNDGPLDMRMDPGEAGPEARPEDIFGSAALAVRGTSPHALTQLRSLARTHARTKRIRFPGWTPPPTSDIYIYL